MTLKEVSIKARRRYGFCSNHTKEKTQKPKNHYLMKMAMNKLTLHSNQCLSLMFRKQTEKNQQSLFMNSKGLIKIMATFISRLKRFSEANGVPLSFSNDTGTANGYYSPKENHIVIKQGMSEQQTLKTIFHEMAHSDLHNLEKLQEEPLKRSTAELQAESVAFVVASHYGLDTSDYSFGYLATWSQDPEGLSDLEAQIKIVQKEADSLISELINRLKSIKVRN